MYTCGLGPDHRDHVGYLGLKPQGFKPTPNLRCSSVQGDEKPSFQSSVKVRADVTGLPWLVKHDAYFEKVSCRRGLNQNNTRNRNKK